MDARGRLADRLGGGQGIPSPTLYLLTTCQRVELLVYKRCLKVFRRGNLQSHAASKCVFPILRSRLTLAKDAASLQGVPISVVTELRAVGMTFTLSQYFCFLLARASGLTAPF